MAYGDNRNDRIEHKVYCRYNWFRPPPPPPPKTTFMVTSFSFLFVAGKGFAKGGGGGDTLLRVIGRGEPFRTTGEKAWHSVYSVRLKSMDTGNM